MSIRERITPRFWHHRDVAAGPFKHLFNFRRIWKLAVGLTVGVTILPLVFLAFIDYQVTRRAMDTEIQMRTSRLVSNTRRSIAFFLAERRSALDFIVNDNSFEALNDLKRLSELLDHLTLAFGGFTDLGVVDALGGQRSYVGPYRLEGVDYGREAWFTEVVEHGVHVSNVFLGFRHVPHLIIAVKHTLPNGSFFILRASIDTERFQDLLAGLEIGGKGDAFIVDHQGVLQTPSRYYGVPLEMLPDPIPAFSESTQTMVGITPDGQPMVLGYAYITETPFILIICKQTHELAEAWNRVRLQVVGILGVSILSILVVILGGATYLVNRIYLADQKRVATLHQVEYANKLALIGRLAAGVAHEINNPLAIINEKSGLVKDLLANSRASGSREEKIVGAINAIQRSVERCAAITRRLLGFARHVNETRVVTSSIRDLVAEVLEFLGREAEYRSIFIAIEIEPETLTLRVDRSSLQQILLNLVHNALAAMKDGGHLRISARPKNAESIRLAIADDGCGIPEPDLKRVFDPFFTTKSEQGGTGLGLSITYNLVQELGGDISVTSRVGEGTVFTITLPVTPPTERGAANGDPAGR